MHIYTDIQIYRRGNGKVILGPAGWARFAHGQLVKSIVTDSCYIAPLGVVLVLVQCSQQREYIFGNFDFSCEKPLFHTQVIIKTSKNSKFSQNLCFPIYL